MATPTWSAGAAGNWSVDANWSGGVKPATGDDVVLDGTSVFNCTVDELPADLNTFTLAADYTGTFDAAAYAFTVASTVSITPGGTFTATGTWTQTGDADFTQGASGTWTITTWDVRLLGSGTVTLRAAGAMGYLTCAAAGKTTTFASTGIGSRIHKRLTIGAGTLTGNVGGSELNITVEPTISDPLVVHSSATVTYSQGYRMDYGGATDATVNIGGPITTSVSFNKSGGAGAFVVNLNANTTLSLMFFRAFTATGAGAFIFNTNNYALTYTVGGLSFGSVVAANVVTVNMGSSIINCVNFCSTNYNDGTSTQTLNMDSSQWTVTGAWTYRSNHTIVPGTSTVTFTGNSATLTGAGKSFNNVVINKTAGQTLTFAGDLTFARMHVASGLISHTSGTIAWSNVVFPAYAGTLFTAAGGSGTITRCTFGASTTGFLINNAGSTYTITNSAYGTGTTGISKTAGTLTTSNNVIGATTAINGQALGAGDVAADPQLGNLPTGCVIDTALCPFPDGYAVGNLAYEFAGSGTFTDLVIDPAIYTSTGYRYAADRVIPIGAMYALTTFPERIVSLTPASGSGGTFVTAVVAAAGAVQGTGRFRLNAVDQPISTWGDAAITFNATPSAPGVVAAQLLNYRGAVIDLAAAYRYSVEMGGIGKSRLHLGIGLGI